MISRIDIEDMTDAQDEAPERSEAELRLLPCPFCGNDGSGPVEAALHLVFSEHDWREQSWTVQCDKCTATMGYSDSEDEAVDGWNLRADLARPSQAGDERVAREAGRAEGWAEAAGFLETLKGADLDGNEFDLPADEWRVAVLMGVRACADKLAALAAMDTPKGGGDE